VDSIPGMSFIFVLLLVGSAFFSASETALTGANRVRLKAQQEQGDKSADRALRLTEQYDKTLSTLLIGNNIVNTLLASLATIFCARLFSAGGVGIATAAVTVLVVIFGEVTPKTYAKNHSEAFIRVVSPVLLGLVVLLTPCSGLLHVIQRLLVPQKKENPTVTEQELKVLFDQSVDEGVLEEDRSELLQNALEFDDVCAEDILTPRVRLAAVEIHADRDEIQQVFLQQHFTRLPVYEKDLDHILGVVSQKDFFAAIVTGASCELVDLVQPCLYVPPRKKVAELLDELQHRRLHVAVVTDEYGGTQGIVTLEDILEQLVGEIWDEHDSVVSAINPVGENSWEVDGETAVEELFDILEADPPEETDAVTVAGFALEQLEHIPAEGEKCIYGNLQFTVLHMEEKRIRTLLVRQIDAG